MIASNLHFSMKCLAKTLGTGITVRHSFRSTCSSSVFFLFSGDSSRRECVTSSRLSRSFPPRLPVLHQRQTKGCNPMPLNTSQTYGEPQAVVLLFYTPTFFHFFFFFTHPGCMPGVHLTSCFGASWLWKKKERKDKSNEIKQDVSHSSRSLNEVFECIIMMSRCRLSVLHGTCPSHSPVGRL